MKVRCIALPNGYTSQHYKMTLGKEYKVLGTFGGIYEIRDDSGEYAFIAKTRFEPINASQEVTK